MKKFFYVIAIFLSIGCLNLIAQDQVNPNDVMTIKNKGTLEKIINNYSKQDNLKDRELVLVIAYHNLALIQEDLKITLEAKNNVQTYYDNYVKKHGGDNPLLLIYLGSLNTLNGRDATKLAQKVSFVNLGLSQMDKAVSVDNNNLLLRVIRSSNNVSLPEMFARREKIKEDLAFIENNDKAGIYKQEIKENYKLLAQEEKDAELKQLYLNKAKN
jgi:hypothetical protein